MKIWTWDTLNDWKSTFVIPKLVENHKLRCNNWLKNIHLRNLNLSRIWNWDILTGWKSEIEILWMKIWNWDTLFGWKSEIEIPFLVGNLKLRYRIWLEICKWDTLKCINIFKLIHRLKMNKCLNLKYFKVNKCIIARYFKLSKCLKLRIFFTLNNMSNLKMVYSYTKRIFNTDMFIELK